MWFKNLRFYRLTKPFELSPEDLHQQLTQNVFQPCAAIAPFSYGWVPPLGHNSELLTHATNSNIMVCARKEEKLLPPAVVREFVAEKVGAIEQEQGRTLRRKEREEIRNEVLLDLLPRAFTRSSYTYAYLTPREKILVVDATTATKAEDLIRHLRETLGSFPVTPLTTNHAPSNILTRWLNGEKVPTDFVIADQCELRDPKKEGGVVRCSQQDLLAEEIQSHLKAGKQVTRLAIEWRERLSCILSDDLTIKRLKFLDVVLDAAQEQGTEDEAAQFDADFALMTLELSRFIPALIEVFGGENDSALATGAS